MELKVRMLPATEYPWYDDVRSQLTEGTTAFDQQDDIANHYKPSAQ